MDRNDILNELKPVFQKVLDKSTIELSMETTANDIEEWDSLNHIQLIVAIEKFYKIRIPSLEIESWKKVGNMVDSILKRLKS